MKLVNCAKCGSNDLFEESLYVVCSYCRTKFTPTPTDVTAPKSVISVYDDIQVLLARCQNEPHNRKRLAALILDIDPSNIDALKYLK